MQLVGTGASVAAPSAVAAAGGTVLGERVGRGRAEGSAVGQGQQSGLGRAAAEGRAAGAAQAVAAPARGIGRSEPEREPVDEAEPTGAAIATKPILSRPTISVLGIRGGQVVTWQLAVLAVALVHRERLGILIPVAAVAVLLIALTVIRRRGRWLYQWLGIWLRYRARRRRRRINGGQTAARDEAASTLLASVARGAEIAPVEIDEIEVAFVSHAGGLTAVLEVVPLDAGHFVEPSRVLPPLTALLPTAEIGEPVISVQVIVQSIPAPNFQGLGDSAAISYRELAEGVIPATRGCWLALQAQHVAEDYTAKDLQDSVMRAVKRLQRRLRKAGLRARMLNGDEIATELLSLARVDSHDPATTGRSRRQQRLASPAVLEGWRTWSAGPQVHTTFRLLDWPDLADPEGRELLDRLVLTPTLATTMTVAARRRPDADHWRLWPKAPESQVELEAAIRITLPSAAAVGSATDQIRTIVEPLGGRIERLDGEQVFGVGASLPLGGFQS